MNDLLSWMTKKTLIRKGYSQLAQMRKYSIRLKVNQDSYFINPPILGNSFPKSGTHLLLQVLENLPGINNYHGFIASRNSSAILKERSLENHLRLINRIVPGEVIPAHLFYSPIYKKELIKINCIHYFIYRDLRDCVVSEVNYITNMNPWHRLHKYFKSLKNDEERISAIILATWNHRTTCDYPNIGDRFNMYSGWLNDNSVFAVRFEDLVSLKQQEIIIRILQNYKKKSEYNFDLDAEVLKIKENINPKKSHTFWKGKIGGWKEYFTERNKDQFKSVAGNILINLNYEKDMNW